MVSEHMLTVGRDPRNWQAHSKDFSLQLSLSKKDLLPLFSSELIQISPFSETIPPFPFWPHEDSTDETTPRSTRYRTTKTTSEWRWFTMHYNNGNYNGWRLRRLGEFEGSKGYLDLNDLGRLPLWNLADYGSCQYPRSRCIEERLKQGVWELEVLSKKTLRHEISTMEW